MRVSLMITCLGDALFPEVGLAAVRLLRRLGHQVDFPAAQTCCGQPHYNSGYHEDARALARHAVAAFERSEIVVAPSGSCAAMVRLEYPGLLRADPRWHARAEALQLRRLAGRRGRKRALLAVGHTLLTIIYHALREGTDYRESGADYLGRRDVQRATRRPAHRLEQLGHQVTLPP